MKRLVTSGLLTMVFSLLLTLGAERVSAQLISAYTYTYTTPSYTAINGTALVSGVSSYDDTVFTGVPLGFTFYFEGVPYTTIGVNSNGFIWFGSGVTSNAEYFPISDATLGTGTVAGVVSAFGANLSAFSSSLSAAPSGNPDIDYITTGAAGAHIFTIQWKGASDINDPGSSSFYGDLERKDLQIKLYEGTNEISVLPHINPYPYLGSSAGQVGIRGASNTDFQSLNVDCSATRWNAGADQSANNAATGLLNPCYPATRSSFNWTPPAVTCPVTITSQASTNPCLGNDGTITIVGAGASPLKYKITVGATVDSNTTGIFTGLAAGTYSVSVSDSACGVSGTNITLVNPTPITASNNGPLCVGATLNLSVTTVASATYRWTGPNGFSSTTQSPSITNVVIADSGIYSVQDSTPGCLSAPVTTHLVINPTPSAPTPVSSNSPICAGATLNLIATAVNGGTYHWTGPNGFSSTGLTPSITNTVIADSGTYSVVDTVAGCVSAPATVSVVINTAPAAPVAGSNSPVCVGSDLNLTASTIVGVTYFWTGPNGFSSSGQNPTINSVVVADSGTYSVYDSVGGCRSQTATVNVVINIPPSAPAPGSNSPLCAGTTLNLTSVANAGALYSWTGPNGYSATTQNASKGNIAVTDSGYYKITDSVPGCASVSDSVLVVVNASAGNVTAFNNGPVCDGQSITLSASTINGVTYNWSGPNGFTSTAQDTTFAVTAINAGTYTVIVSNGTSCGTSQDSTTIVVNAAPVAPAPGSNSPLCAGTTLNLTSTANAGAIYSWTGPNGFNSGGQNASKPNVVVADSGYYKITDSVPGCSTVSDSVLVVVNPGAGTVTASNNGPVCDGQNVTLSATTINGATYTWSGPNGFTSSAQDTTFTITAANAGIYSVTATSNGACGTSQDSTTVVVNPIPTTPTVSNNGPVCPGDTLSLSVTSQTNATYAWSGPNGFNSNQQNPNVTAISANSAGEYAVTVTIGTCGNSVDSTLVVVNTQTPAVTASNDGPVCASQTLQLDATVINGVVYGWTGPNGFTAQIRNPTIPGITLADSGWYKVTVTGTCGTSTDSTFVRVTSVTANPVLGSNSPLCVGLTLNLTCATVPGATYRWSGPANYSANVQNATRFNMTAADSGVYSITVTIAGCGSATASTNVSVVTSLPTPSIQVVNNPACEGSTLTLSTPVLSNGSYEWTGPNGFIGVGDTITIPFVDSAHYAGVYNLNVSSGNCIGNSNTTVTITPKPLVKVVDGQYCYGLPAVLDAGHFSSYSWSTQATTETITLTYLDTVVHTGITVTDGNGCTASEDVVSQFLSRPDTTTILQNGDVLYSSWTSAKAYQWYLNGDTVPGAHADSLVIGSNAGTYTLLVTDSNSCSTTSQAYSAVSGINSVGAGSDFVLYPNPATGHIFLVSGTEVENYVIYNPTGQEIARKEGLRVKQATIDLQNFAKGVYILQAVIGTEKVTRRFAVME